MCKSVRVYEHIHIINLMDIYAFIHVNIYMYVCAYRYTLIHVYKSIIKKIESNTDSNFDGVGFTWYFLHMLSTFSLI